MGRKNSMVGKKHSGWELGEKHCGRSPTKFLPIHLAGASSQEPKKLSLVQTCFLPCPRSLWQAHSDFTFAQTPHCTTLGYLAEPDNLLRGARQLTGMTVPWYLSSPKNSIYGDKVGAHVFPLRGSLAKFTSHPANPITSEKSITKHFFKK